MRTVAVFFGGRSNEREISVITGMYAVNLLRGADVRVVPVYLAEDNTMYTSPQMNRVDFFRDFSPDHCTAVRLERGRIVWQKKPKKTVAQPDCALNCCHGGAGEDGTLSALLDFYKIPNASPQTPVSAVFMDKTLSKIAAKGLGIPVPESFVAVEGQPMSVPALQFPLIVKPARLGSSIGIHIAETPEELDQALKEAFRLDGVALVERYIKNKRDVNCAAYRKGGKIILSECEEVFSDGKILSFSEKYEGTGARKSKIPADLPEECSAQIHEYTRRIYDSFRVRGVVRADFLVADGKVYFNELNTVPGSLSSYLFGERLYEAKNFLLSLVEEAIASPVKERELISSGILQSGVFSGSKRKL